MIKKLKSSSPCEIMSCSLKHHKMSPDAAKTQENSDMCCSRNQSLLAAGRPPSAPPPRQRRRHLPALPPLPQPVTNFSADRLPLPGPGVTLPPPGLRSPPAGPPQGRDREPSAVAWGWRRDPRARIPPGLPCPSLPRAPRRGTAPGLRRGPESSGPVEARGAWAGFSRPGGGFTQASSPPHLSFTWRMQTHGRG